MIIFGENESVIHGKTIDGPISFILL